MISLAQLDGNSLNLLLTGVFGMVLLSILLIAFFLVYQRRIIAQERLRTREERQHQRNLLAAAVEVQESERRRIARDLHDEIGSLLTATRLYLRQISPETKPEKTLALKEESLHILDEMIQNARRITHDLLPPELEKFGFLAAVEDLLERVDRSGGIVAEFCCRSERRLLPRQEIALFRVIQELVNNTLKHANATRIEVRTEWQSAHFSLSYRDNGKGFSVPAGGYSGLGLKNIESRVSLIGGSLDFDTKPGKGLHVAILIPLNEKPIRGQKPDSL